MITKGGSDRLKEKEGEDEEEEEEDEEEESGDFFFFDCSRFLQKRQPF